MKDGLNRPVVHLFILKKKKKKKENAILLSFAAVPIHALTE